MSREENNQPRHILVVDDEPMLREILREGLGELGFRVTEAPGGAEALALLTKDPKAVDLVVLDMKMPGWDGLHTLVRLREIRPDLPAVFSTGYLDVARLREFEQAGFVDVVQKPFRLHQIFSTIQRLLDRCGKPD